MSRDTLLDEIAPAQVATAGAAEFDAEEERLARTAKIDKVAKYVMPVLVLALMIGLWEWVVRANEIPHYVLPSPGLVAQTLIEDWGTLSSALLITLKITFLALLVAVVGAVTLSILFTQSKWIEMSLSAFAVVLQVTPIIAVAPLIFIYLDSRLAGLLLCAWLVAFFPILANTTLGLKSADKKLHDLMTIYQCNRWQRLMYLQIPAALPYFLGGLKIAGGLALIGAIVAEYVAGTGGMSSGLAFRILEASYRLNIPRMFAAVFLIAVTGVAIFWMTSFLNWLLLRKWHESALAKD